MADYRISLVAIPSQQIQDLIDLFTGEWRFRLAPSRLLTPPVHHAGVFPPNPDPSIMAKKPTAKKLKADELTS